MARKSKTPNLKILHACRVKEIDPTQVVAIEFEADDIILAVRGMGQVRVERSALPAEIEALPDTPEVSATPTTTQAQPTPGQKKARKSARKRRKV